MSYVVFHISSFAKLQAGRMGDWGLSSEDVRKPRLLVRAPWGNSRGSEGAGVSSVRGSPPSLR